MLQIHQLIRDFQRDCIVTGPDRAKLLQKLLAGGVAYAYAIPQGELIEENAFYNTSIRDIATDIIGHVNEIIVINTHETMADCRKAWSERYILVNSPHLLYAKAIDATFRDDVEALGSAVCNGYTTWIERFVDGVRRQMASGE